jgi:hypothetical protein
MTGRLVPLFAAALVAGCQPSGDISDLHPLTGTVTRDGKAVTSGGLQFTPVSGGTGGLTVDASVNKDGTFAAQSSKWSGKETVFKPGLKPGRYKVTYVPESDGQKTGLEVELPTVVVVEPKENTIALELPSKLPAGNGLPRNDANPPDKAEPKKD